MSEIEREFELFWVEYPRKQAKLDAMKAFRFVRTKYNITVERLIDAVRRYRARLEEDETETCYIKLPAGWLRSGQWMDEEPATIKPQPLFRPARNVDELRQYLKSIGKPVSAEIAKARDVTDLPAFARMVPVDWHPNVTPLRKVSA